MAVLDQVSVACGLRTDKTDIFVSMEDRLVLCHLSYPLTSRFDVFPATMFFYQIATGVGA